MLTTLTHFFYLDGYGIYVFPAYAIVFVFLAALWIVPKKRWQQYLRDHCDE